MRSTVLIATIPMLLIMCSAHPSVEKDLKIATEMTCERLLYDAVTLHGSLTDIEYAVSFALEEKSSIYERGKASGDSPKRLAELRQVNLQIARAIAMHRLFQIPKCPIERDWYQYKPSKIGRNSLWD